MTIKAIEPVYAVKKHVGIITIQQTLKESELISLYVDWVNNFTTLERFAEYYGYPIDSANYIIEKGRELMN